MNGQTQCEKVLDYIKRNGSITQREALGLGIYRLASRVSDLKKAGYDIRSVNVVVVNKDGTKSHIAKYEFRTMPKDLAFEI